VVNDQQSDVKDMIQQIRTVAAGYLNLDERQALVHEQTNTNLIQSSNRGRYCGRGQ